MTNQIYIEKDSQQIQCSIKEYLSSYKREGWRILSYATPLLDVPGPEGIHVDLKDLQSTQGILL